MLKFLKKWLWCSWKHNFYKCWPEVWIENSKHWHCSYCHPCSEAFDLLFISNAKKDLQESKLRNDSQSKVLQYEYQLIQAQAEHRKNLKEKRAWIKICRKKHKHKDLT